MASDSPDPVSNLSEWSVSELSGALKRTLEDAFGFVRLRGEISGYRGPHSSGHAYFSIKDANARIDAVIWKGVFARMRIRPEEGMEVIATGRITTFPGKSSYQIIVDALEPAGIGALMALLDQRRRALAAEGLFDAGRKRPLPYLPRVIGVVTSPTGAVIRDILHRLQDRFPRHVIVWPVRVQGETSAEEVAAAIRGFNALEPGGPIPRPDVMIVARGGGSLEDLWSFNEEIVVRAAAESAIPLISAVGHETDRTLIDEASDRRAPTPTAAAEIVVPVRADLLLVLDDLARRQAQSLLRSFERRRADLRGLARALPTPEGLVAVPRQRLDLAATRLASALARNARREEGRLVALSARLARRTPAAQLARAGARLIELEGRLGRAGPARVARARDRLERLSGLLVAATRGERERLMRRSADLTRMEGRAGRAFLALSERRGQRLASLWQLLDSMSHTKVLARGFVLVRSDGALVPRAVGLAAGQRLEIQFADGKVAAVAGEGGEVPPSAAPARPARPRSRSDGDGGQGALF